METFSPDVPPTTEFTLRDQSGIGSVIASYRHTSGTGNITLQGDGNGETETTVFLRLGGWSAPLPAGEYQCHELIASDLAGNHKTYTLDGYPQLADKRFLYQYPSGQPGDTEGPELIG